MFSVLTLKGAIQYQVLLHIPSHWLPLGIPLQDFLRLFYTFWANFSITTEDIWTNTVGVICCRSGLGSRFGGLKCVFRQGSYVLYTITIKYQMRKETTSQLLPSCGLDDADSVRSKQFWTYPQSLNTICLG